jgi:hypothetical protein
MLLSFPDMVSEYHINHYITLIYLYLIYHLLGRVGSSFLTLTYFVYVITFFLYLCLPSFYLQLSRYLGK